MMRVMRGVSVCFVLFAAMIFASCGGGGVSIGVAVSPNSEGIDVGQNVTITATVTNDSTNSGVSWTCSGAACPANPPTSTSFTFSPAATGSAQFTAASVKQPSVSKSVTITVSAAPSTTTAQAQVTAATAGTAYSLQVTASGGTGSLTYSATGLPADGLSMSASGLITGTPTAKSTVTFTYKVKDSSAAGAVTSAASASLSITVNNPPPPAITTTQSQVVSGTAGTAYSMTFRATGSGTLTWSATGLPSDGLSLNASTGVVSGTPTTAQPVPFSLTVSDSFGQSSAATAFTITVNNPPAPTISTTQSNVNTAGPAIVGTTYSFQFQGTGTGTLTWSATGLPADGLSLNSTTGVVSGTPTTAQTVPVTVTLHDTFGQSSAPTAFTITVNNPPPALSISKTHTGDFSQGQAGATYTVTVSNSSAVGTGPTDGTTVTVTDTIPAGESLVSMAGTGWTCVANTCTRLDVLAAGASYPSVTVTVNVSSTAPTPQVNQVSVSGGGSASANTSDSTTIVEPVLSVTKSHTGNFTQGQQNATYSVVVSNTGLAATSGTVTLTETVPTGMTLVSMAGTNWTCGNPNPSNVCTRSDALASSASYDTITVTVNVASNAGSPLVNQVTASGGGSISANGSDSTNITSTCGSGHESMLNGQYAFVLTGFDNETPTPQPALIGGVLSLNGSGSITAGTIDMNLNGGVSSGLPVTSGSYSIGSDQRGCMTIATSAGTNHYAISVGGISSGVASKGHMIGFDITGPFVAGIFKKQTTSAFSTSQVTGNYVFGVSAPQNSVAGGGKFGAVGVFNFSTGTITGGSVDFNQNGTLEGNNTLTVFPATPPSINSGGSYTVSGSTGRGTLTFTPSGAGSAVNGFIYVVSATEVLVMSGDTQTNANNSIWAGEMMQQSGSFSDSTISGNYVDYNNALGSSAGTTRATIILANTSSGSLTNATVLQNDGGSVTSQTGQTGSFSVASNGRALLTLNGQSNKPVFYLANGSFAFYLNSNGGVESGVFESQSAGPFTAASASGTYAFGTIFPDGSGANASDNSGAAVFDGVGSITGTSDSNGSGSSPSNNPISQTYSVDSTGLGLSPANCTLGSNCQTAFYVVSSNQAFVIEVKNAGSQDPSVQIADK